MRKRIISLAAAAALAVSALSLSAFAESQGTDPKLPFELSAPTNVSLTYLDGNDSYNTCEIAYSQNNSMSQWATRNGDPDEHDKVIEELNAMGYDGVWVNAQVDWSIDSQDDWKCNEYWLTDGYDADYKQHLGDWAYTSMDYSAETTNSAWIFRGMGNANDPEDRTWHGHHADGEDFDGWKDVLKEDQYTLIANDDGEKYAKIDLNKHTIYTRVRWRVTVRPLEGDDTYVVSDWSDIAAVGKDAVKIDPIKPDELDKPEISDLHYTDKDFNNYPVIAFKLAVSDKLKEQLTRASGTRGAIWLEVEAKIEGSEWVGLQGDWVIKAGDMEMGLQNLMEKTGSIKKGTPIKLRARYWCSQVGVEQDFYTQWTTISFAAETVDRIAGENRFGTAAEIAKVSYEKAETVVLAFGLNYADALAGVPLAYQKNAPILLTGTKSMPKETTNAIEKLGAKNVIILGGEGAISKDVEKTLQNQGLTTKRLAGQSRFGTATAIADELNEAPTDVIFVYAFNSADALSVSTVAALKGAPIIYLSTKGELNADTAAYLAKLKKKGCVKNAYVIGGEGVISNDMMNKAASAVGLKTATRVAGQNRYETCVEVNTKFADLLTGPGICVAKGLDFPDALAGGVYAAINREPLFLADSYKLQECQTNYLKGKKATRISVFGGIGAVPDNVVKVIEKASK